MSTLIIYAFMLMVHIIIWLMFSIYMIVYAIPYLLIIGNLPKHFKYVLSIVDSNYSEDL
jgi:hypothetical protein